VLRAEWRQGAEYSLEADSAAFEDIYGLVSGKYKQGIKVKTNDEYSTLFVHLTGINATRFIVQLLSTSGSVVKQVHPVNGTAEFYYVAPGKYYLKAFLDANDNGVWDTGDYDADRQPEEVYYYPNAIECKAKWDVTEHWNLLEVPLDRQKPAPLIKEKTDTKKKLQNRNADRAKKLGIPIPDEYKW
jgi:hypothetical protein